jgi:hypothetical protein
MEWKILLAIGGWVIAVVQFFLKYSETKDKNEAELLEKTLGYFERGTQSRSIAISLIEGIWFKKKKNLDIILPVLISQTTFLLTEAMPSRQEERNLIRLLYLIKKCLPYAIDIGNKTAEISEALLHAGHEQNGMIQYLTIRRWYINFTGDSELFDAECEEINDKILERNI